PAALPIYPVPVGVVPRPVPDRPARAPGATRAARTTRTAGAGDLDGDGGGGRPAVAVAGGVGEAVDPVEVRRRGVRDRAAGVDGRGPVRRGRHRRDGEGVAVHVGVVGQDGDGHRRVLGRGRRVGVGHRRVVHR